MKTFKDESGLYDERWRDHNSQQYNQFADNIWWLQFWKSNRSNFWDNYAEEQG